VDRGGYVVVVDAHDSTEAARAQSLLRELEAGDLNLIDRQGQRPLREIVAERGMGGAASADARDDLTHAPGLRYSDKD
jgi:hypothetical protein